jgi:hypothetical protein
VGDENGHTNRLEERRKHTFNMSILIEYLRVLHARLVKEIDRGQGGTAALGGFAKTAIALEKLLMEAARECCRVDGILLESELISRGVPGSLGAYVRIVCDHQRAGIPDSTDANIVNSLVADYNSRQSATKSLLYERNKAMHGDEEPPRNVKDIFKRLMCLVEKALLECW